MVEFFLRGPNVLTTAFIHHTAKFLLRNAPVMRLTKSKRLKRRNPFVSKQQLVDLQQPKTMRTIYRDNPLIPSYSNGRGRGRSPAIRNGRSNGHTQR
jgi:hypothetical protein